MSAGKDKNEALQRDVLMALEDYFAGEAEPEAAARFIEVLKRDSDRARLVSEYLVQHELLAELFRQERAGDSEKFVADTLASIDRRLSEEGAPSAIRVMARLGEGSHSAGARARGWRMFWGWRLPLAVAASLGLAAGGWWLAQGRLPVGLGLRVVEVAGKATVENGRLQIGDGKSGSLSEESMVYGPKSKVPAKPVTVGMELRRGDCVVVSQGGKVGLKYDGEATTIDLHSAVAAFGAEQGAKRVRLASGLLLCEAARQAKSFCLKTPNGVATVVGTRFALDAAERETTLAVKEGAVVLARGTKRLEVRAGDTAVADAKELRVVSSEDAWIKELMLRSETGPWDAVDFGKGAFVQSNWRMDARGSAAERLLWNVLASPKVELVRFDSARWKRAVVTCQVMLPGAEAVVPVSPVEGEKPNPQMAVSGSVGGLGPAPNVLALSAFVYSGEQPGIFGEAISLTRGNPISYDVWHKMVLYFDLNAEGGPMVLSSFWRAADGVPAAAQWSSAVLPKFERGGKAGFGWLVGPNYRVWVKGMKLVPLGGEMAQPPAGLRGGALITK